MITAVKNAALSVCGTMVITGIFMMLLPSAGQNRTVRLAASLFFLLSLAAPLAGEQAEWRNSFSLRQESCIEQTDFSLLTEKALLQEFERCLKQQAETILQQEEIEPLKIEFIMHTDDEKRISITGLELLLRESDADRSARAIGRLNETFGVTVTLSLESEGSEGENNGY